MTLTTTLILAGTVTFAALKLAGVLGWPWLFILLPLAAWLLIVAAAALSFARLLARTGREFDE